MFPSGPTEPLSLKLYRENIRREYCHDRIGVCFICEEDGHSDRDCPLEVEGRITELSRMYSNIFVTGVDGDKAMEDLPGQNFNPHVSTVGHSQLEHAIGWIVSYYAPLPQHSYIMMSYVVICFQRDDGSDHRNICGVAIPSPNGVGDYSSEEGRGITITSSHPLQRSPSARLPWTGIKPSGDYSSEEDDAGGGETITISDNWNGEGAPKKKMRLIL